MSFRTRILAAMAVIGVAPVVLLGLTSLLVNRDEILSSAGAAELRTADDLADACGRFVLDATRSVGLAAGYIPFDRLTPGEASAVFQLPLRQLPWLEALVLLDARGDALAPPTWAGPREGGAAPTTPGREDLDAFASHVPLEAALSAGLAVGPPFRTGLGPRVAVGVRLPGPSPRVLAAELALDELVRRLRAHAGADGRATLLDAQGALVVDTAGRERLDSAEEELLRRAQRREGERIQLTGGHTLSAAAPVEPLGWAVVTTRPATAALRAAARVRRSTLFWAGTALTLSAGLGLLLARSVSAPVARLSHAAAAVSGGDYEGQVEEGGGRELAGLARAFNRMTDEVRRRDAEIRTWNAELQARVEARTAELREAQEQIARSRRLAALGSLSAGVAHALNNPMTSVMGLVALARKRVGPSEASALLDEALSEAQRAVKVAQDLRGFAEREREDAGQCFSLDRPVLAALDAFRPRLDAAGIAVRAEIAPALPQAQGEPERIEQLVGHLVENALAAMPRGGALDVSLGEVDGRALRLSVADSGPGIPAEIAPRIFDPFFTTRPDGGGMGLSLAHTIVEAHHGSIRFESPPGGGTRFTVVLPAAPEAAHLV